MKEQRRMLRFCEDEDGMEERRGRGRIQSEELLKIYEISPVTKLNGNKTQE